MGTFQPWSVMRCVILSVAASTTPTTLFAADAASEHADVRLHPHAVVAGDLIRVEDVAEIRSQSPAFAARIAALDLCPRADDGSEQVIDRAWIDVRLRLAGFADSAVTVGGAACVVVSRNHEVPFAISDRYLEQVARSTLSLVAGVPEDDLRVRLLQPVAEHWRTDPRLTSATHCEILPADASTLGRVTCVARVFSGERLLDTRSVPLFVERRCGVLVATTHRARGDSLNADDVHCERRYVTTPSDVSEVSGIEGALLRLALQPGEVLTRRHLALPVTRNAAAAVRARHRVQATARRGAVTVVLHDAEALESGVIGEQIRLRNRTTGVILTGRVTGPGTVVLE